MRGRPWTSVADQMMREFYPIMPTEALAKVIGRPARSLYMRAQSLGLRKTPEYLAGPFSCRLRRGTNPGIAFRFKPGQQPWNKGRHYVAGGRSAETRFKRGQLNGRAAQLVAPVGSYRVTSDGYLDRKVCTQSGPNTLRWKPVHRLVWIEANGPIPAGHVVVFKPGRRTTELDRITPDALELVRRDELMRRNSVHTRMPPELARLVQLRGALNRKINRIERKQA